MFYCFKMDESGLVSKTLPANRDVDSVIRFQALISLFDIARMTASIYTVAQPVKFHNTGMLYNFVGKFQGALI